MSTGTSGEAADERSFLSRSHCCLCLNFAEARCESCGSEKKLTKIIDSGNKQWEFKYDMMGNVIEMIYPDLSKIEQRFDVAGRLEWFKNKRGQEITYAYDSDGRLIIKTLPEGTVDFSYDDRDRLSEVSGPGYHYKYDYGVAFVGGNSPLVKETNLENGLWVQHIYDTNGLPVRYYDSFLWEKGYQYNFTSGTGTPIGFTPTKVWYAKKGIGTTYNTEYKHDPMGRLRNKLNTFLGTEEWYTYDSKGLLQQLLYRQYPNMSGSFPTVTLDLQRDLSGLITGLTGAKQLSASFNPDLEITAVQHTFPTTFSEAYSYDPRGNRLASLSNTFAYNDLNQLLESATHTYTYDADGNLIQERNKASGETKKYFYNAENRLTGYEHYANEFTSVDQIAQYTYDLYGRRIQKTVNGNVTNFLWDEDNISLELNENNQPIRRYVYGVGMDNVEGHFEYAEATSNPFATDHRGWYTYIKDQVGTIYKTFSHGTSQVVNSRAYDTFGNLISQSGTSKSPLGFQSKYLDPESGLYYFYHRYYSPSLGRFTTEDPIGLISDLNVYRFTRNNPLNAIDPSGLITDINSFASPSPGWPSPDPRMSMWMAFQTTTSEAFEEFKQFICGENYSCDRRSTWEKIMDNFSLTNELPGKLAPWFTPLITSQTFASYIEGTTLVQWIFQLKLGGTTLGGVAFTGIETGIIAGMTTLVNWSMVSVAFEGGVFIGSVLKALICQ